MESNSKLRKSSSLKRGEMDSKSLEAEKFFELLGNIKALKDSFKERKNKKKKLWRPVLTMEDFREDCEAESSWINGANYKENGRNFNNCNKLEKGINDEEEQISDNDVVIN